MNWVTKLWCVSWSEKAWTLKKKLLNLFTQEVYVRRDSIISGWYGLQNPVDSIGDGKYWFWILTTRGVDSVKVGVAKLLKHDLVTKDHPHWINVFFHRQRSAAHYWISPSWRWWSIVKAFNLFKNSTWNQQIADQKCEGWNTGSCEPLIILETSNLQHRMSNIANLYFAFFYQNL